MFYKSRNIGLGLIGALVLGMPTATALNIGISPSRIEMEVSSKTRSQSIRVLNLSSESVELKASVRSWAMSEDNKLQDVAPSEQSLEQWIVFTPSQFKIPAGGAQTIRFAVRPRVQPKQGEHRAVIYLEEVRPANQANQVNKPKTKSVRVAARVGVVIYGYVGDVKRVGIVNSVTVDTKPNTPNAVFDISNQGNAYVRLKGQYAIWPATKYPGAEATGLLTNFGKPGAKVPENVLDAGLLPSAPILPSNRRQIRLPITTKLPPGKYVFDINGELSGVSINKGIPFTVPLGNTIEAKTPPTSRNLRNSLRRK
ncbi:molecular chaperone [Nostoc sp. FACHB-133]|uniref:fimbrial biogenesis chaperone n=1 Tax=Nostoc sp. FACHB-133 TaxID=2692835 RepID=UPI0016890D07|nr:fimbria/pilus periplasmic chaperone [Nostoc sp. FACHB-133]MBD2523584.1 fimbria/pilus periplasmic chaperone [Nostoc sp. FACHB-133]